MISVLLAVVAIVPSGQTFTCTPTAVWDGDGPIWCAEGPRVRLAGIAAREIDDKCRDSHPCPTASGVAARDKLVSFLGGPKGKLRTGHIKVSAAPMRCLSGGSAGGNRTAAWCKLAGGADLNCAMIKSGAALRWQRYWRGHRC